PVQSVIGLMVTGTVGLVVSLVFHWDITLVMLGFGLMVVAITIFEKWATERITSILKPQAEEATNFALTAVANIRTLHIIGRTEYMAAKYEELLLSPLRLGVSKALLGGLMRGLGLAVFFLSYIVAFWYCRGVFERSTIPLVEELRNVLTSILALMWSVDKIEVLAVHL
ncbi:GTPase-activating protein, partial [Chytridiales sp. JEL 0842]